MKYKTVVIDHLNCLFSNQMYIPDCCISFAFRCIMSTYVIFLWGMNEIKTPAYVRLV